MEKIDIFLEPFIRYWDIKRSKGTSVVYSGAAIGYGYEPPNKSTEYGLSIGIRF